MKTHKHCSQWKLRENLVDDDLKDTVTYTMRQNFIFRPDLSNGLTGNEEVIVPNLVMLVTTMTVKQEREAFLSATIKAMNHIFGNVSSPFVRIRAMDLMFDGMPFNCTGNEFSVKAVCAAIKSEGKQQGVSVVNETHLAISLLGHVSYAYTLLTLLIDYRIKERRTCKYVCMWMCF
jgi:scavenger receptor class B, member 1